VWIQNHKKKKKDYMCMRLPLIPWSIAGMPSSRALPGYLITAPAPECIPFVIGALPEWIQTQQKQNKKCKERKEQYSVSCCGNPAECLRAGRFRATPLLHTNCVRCWCNLRANCVAANTKKKTFSTTTLG